MRTIIVAGSAGLLGSETVKRFAKEGARVVGIDNDMRARPVLWHRSIDKEDA
jgi:CDP-paratose 2-epimerase